MYQHMCVGCWWMEGVEKVKDGGRKLFYVPRDEGISLPPPSIPPLSLFTRDNGMFAPQTRLSRSSFVSVYGVCVTVYIGRERERVGDGN